MRQNIDPRMEKDAEEYDDYREKKRQEAKEEIQSHKDDLLKLIRIDGGSSEVVYMSPDEIDPSDLGAIKGTANEWNWVDKNEELAKNF